MVLAQRLGLAEVVTLLNESLEEEKATDGKLGQMAAAAKLEDALRAH